jgi:hypothetical protein
MTYKNRKTTRNKEKTKKLRKIRGAKEIKDTLNDVPCLWGLTNV